MSFIITLYYVSSASKLTGSLVCPWWLGPSALSLEEQRLLQSLNRLNERLKGMNCELLYKSWVIGVNCVFYSSSQELMPVTDWSRTWHKISWILTFYDVKLFQWGEYSWRQKYRDWWCLNFFFYLQPKRKSPTRFHRNLEWTPVASEWPNRYLHIRSNKIKFIF